jgi:hypothetical protein
MALQQSNTTCDIYRQGNAPPSAPDVAGVACFLSPDFAPSHLAAVSGSSWWRWTHVMLVGPTVDVRDPYLGGVVTSGEEAGSSAWADAVYVPNKNGTKFQVIFVERVALGTSQDVKRVYLQRQSPSWPTNNL